MNKGIDHLNGDYVLFLNSGDFLHSNDVIEKVYDQLDADIVYGDDPGTSEEPEVPTYTLTFVGGNDGKVDKYEAGATIDYPTLKEEGKTFEGWYVVNAETGEWTKAPETMPEGDLTVEAKWTLVTKTVTVNKLDGSVVTYTIAVEDNKEENAIAYTNMAEVLEANVSEPSEKHCVVKYDGKSTWFSPRVLIVTPSMCSTMKCKPVKIFPI